MSPQKRPLNWQYERHPLRATVLPRVTSELMREIADGTIDARRLMLNTRGSHRRLFHSLTPPGYEHLAGHYRGEDIGMLRNCRTIIPINPLVGYPPETVIEGITDWGQQAWTEVSALDKLRHDTTVSPDDQLIRTIKSASDIFSAFLLIHPYANGNGHIARLCLTSILARYGRSLKNLFIEPSPGGIDRKEYDRVIQMHQEGKRDPLYEFIAARTV